MPLIGFTGAPFTLASYMIEGGPSKNYNFTKAMMYSDEATWFALMDHLVDMSITYTTAQIEAGAEIIQVFDSCWCIKRSRLQILYKTSNEKVN